MTVASRVERLVGELAGSGAVTAAVALVGSDREVEVEAGAGVERPGAGPPDGASLFDLASLTKPSMATLALHLHATGEVPLDRPLGETWPEAHPDLAGRRVGDLLRHRAGLEPWLPFYRRCRRPEGAARLLVGGDYLGARLGTYSDLDFVLWGLAAERVTGEGPGELFRRRVAAPLAAELVAPPGRRAGVVACRLDNGREVALAAAQGIRVARRPPPEIGTVQDGNARFLGPPTAHAGLFGSARGLWRLAREWLVPGDLLPAAAVEQALSGGGPFALGWMRRRVRNSAGRALSRAAFGHVGFTGGSLWIDPEAGRIFVLLAHRAAVSVDLDPWRRRFHALASAGR